MKAKEFLGLFKETGSEWLNDNVPRLGAALAYYSIFSLAPLLLLAIGIAGLVFGREAAQGQMIEQIRQTVGDQVGQAIEETLKPAQNGGLGTLATVVGVLTLLFGASGVFGQLQDALNTIWRVQPKPGRGVIAFIRDRFLSLTMVLGTGFLLLVSLVISTALQAVSKLWTPTSLPGGALLWETLNTLISLGFITLLFALIFKYLPDAKIAWRDVGIGAALSAVLFVLGKSLLGLYLGHSSTISAYGAAGSIVLILLWVYYSSQIVLFGAEFTRVYASHYGSGIQPAANAVLVTQEERARQGMTRQDKAQPVAQGTLQGQFRV